MQALLTSKRRSDGCPIGRRDVIKYAHATRVEVRLMTTVNTGELHIIDNGRGFNADSVAAGIGLDNMRERAGPLERFTRFRQNLAEELRYSSSGLRGRPGVERPLL